MESHRGTDNIAGATDLYDFTWIGMIVRIRHVQLQRKVAMVLFKGCGNVDINIPVHNSIVLLL